MRLARSAVVCLLCGPPPSSAFSVRDLIDRRHRPWPQLRTLSFRALHDHLPIMRALLRGFRRLLTALGVILLLLAAVAAGILWLTLPPRSQQAHIAGLSGRVDIGFDTDGVPRIRAASAT